MKEKDVDSTSTLRTVIFLVLWFGGGAWGLDKLSTHRSFTCSGMQDAAQCIITEHRLSGSRVAHRVTPNAIVSAYESKRVRVNRIAGDTQLRLKTRDQDIWISDDHIKVGISKWNAADKINTYLAGKGEPALRLEAPLPTVFWVTSAVFGVISLIFLGAIALWARAGAAVAGP